MLFRSKPSLEAASKIAGEFDEPHFDFIFVDGDHSYDATFADCVAYYPLLKKGGLFCGHDYSNLPDVNKAVNEFRTVNNITAPINLSSNSTFFWYK